MRIRWDPLTEVWSRVVWPGYAEWLFDRGLCPQMSISGAYLRGANLSEAYLRGAAASAYTAWPPEFDGVVAGVVTS